MGTTNAAVVAKLAEIVTQVQSLHIIDIPADPVPSASSAVANAIDFSLYLVFERPIHWMIDSGCTLHVTNTLADFAKYHAFPILGMAHLAGQHHISIVSKGTVQLHHMNSDGQTIQLTLTNVLYVPEASTHYFASHIVLDKGGHYTASRSMLKMWSGLITDSIHLVTVHSGPSDNGLFWFTAGVYGYMPTAPLVATISSSYDLWHK